MTVRFADIVDWDSLRNTVVYGLIAGVVITAPYGFALLGLNRAQETGGDLGQNRPQADLL